MVLISCVDFAGVIPRNVILFFVDLAHCGHKIDLRSFVLI